MDRAVATVWSSAGQLYTLRNHSRSTRPDQNLGQSVPGSFAHVCASVSKPVNVLIGLTGATYSVEALAAAGVKRISVGGSFARAALGAFVRAARDVKDKATFSFAANAYMKSLSATESTSAADSSSRFSILVES